MKSKFDGTIDQPLKGIKVLDFGQVYQGPYATYLMAQAGADVIKIEAPTGEPLRQREVKGGPAIFQMGMLNANKRAITLDLKTEKGKQLLRDLVPHMDILLENFTPGVMDRLGVGASSLQQINPRLIYASGTGYGLSGPDKDAMAMDITVQAMSGIMSVTGEEGGPPVRVGPAIADFMGGIHLYSGVMTALYERERTGKGRLVEVSMLESVYPTLASGLGAMYDNNGEIPPRPGNRGALNTAPYSVFEAADGYISIFCLKEDHWTNLCDAMSKPELATDSRFATSEARAKNLELTEQVVTAWSSQLPKDKVFELLCEHRVPAAPVRTMKEVSTSEHMFARGSLQKLAHPDLGEVTLPTSPLRYHGTPQNELTPSPRLGQHNHEVLAEFLNLSAEQVDQLREEGAI